MQDLSSKNLETIASKLKEFMQYSQKLSSHDTYLIVNRNSPILTEAAEKAAKSCQLDVRTFNLDRDAPYEHFPSELLAVLQHETPKAGMGLFDYSANPDWSLKELGARIELLHNTEE